MSRKEWRIYAHKCFDKLWKSGRMSRNQAYQWLAAKLNMSRRDAHISRFGKELCELTAYYSLLKYVGEDK